MARGSARGADDVVAGIAVWLGRLVVGLSWPVNGHFWCCAWVQRRRGRGRGRDGGGSRLVVGIGVP